MLNRLINEVVIGHAVRAVKVMRYGVHFSVAQQPLVDQRLLIVEASRSQTHLNQQVSSGRVISPTQRSLTTHNTTDRHSWYRRVRTRNPSKRAVADPRLRPLGH
jgi:hypothetical protein